MKKIIGTILFLLAVCCNNEGNKSRIGYRVDKAAKTVQTWDSLSDIPTRNFVTIVRLLDSLEYSSDATRSNKSRNYKEIVESEVRFFDGFPFYKIDKEKTKILWWNTLVRQKEDSIETKIFEEAESVWGYFYSKTETRYLTVDGIIEQWTFPDNTTAETALDDLRSFYPLPYFNTEPYYLTDGKFLFVFHTRASAFSYRQKEFFNKFREMSSAPANSL
jgi:hypothetical protein